MDLDQAILRAIALNAQASEEGLDVVYAEADQQLDVLMDIGLTTEGLQPIAIGALSQMPISVTTKKADPSLIDKTRGRAFVDKMLELLKTDLCAFGSELRSLVEQGITVGVGAVLTAVLTVLAVGPVAIGLLVPVAVVIAQKGVVAYCELH